MADEAAESVGAFDAMGQLVFWKTRSLSTAKERFWKFVIRVGSCWEWAGGVQRGGYGHFMYHIGRAAVRQVGSHRFSWEMLYGPIPEGLHVCHTCDNPRCVRPSHLWLGTDKTNAEDKMRKGRGNLESRRWIHPRRRYANLKLDWAKAETIRARRLAGESPFTLASEFGVSYATILLVMKGKRWAKPDGFENG